METFMYFLLMIAFGLTAFSLPFILKKGSYLLSISIYLLLMAALVCWINFLCGLI